VRTLANIVDNFKAGETYNIGGGNLHTIEDLAEVVLKVTNKDRSLVRFYDSERLTTKVKRVDITKAIRDLDHKNNYSLEDGMHLTADWLRKVYKIT